MVTKFMFYAIVSIRINTASMCHITKIADFNLNGEIYTHTHTPAHKHSLTKHLLIQNI